ncbi:hypothetical protein Tco_1011490, partial [Tanacetum coccineum]
QLNMGLAGYWGRLAPIPSVGINLITASGIRDRRKYRADLKCQFGSVDIRTTNKAKSESEDLNEIDIETLTLKQYLALNRNKSQVGVKRHEIEKNIVFEIKSQLLRELHENNFSGEKTDNAMEHVQKILEIILDSRGLITRLTAAEALESIQEIVEHSHKWHKEESDKKTSNNSLSTIMHHWQSISVMPFSIFKRPMMATAHARIDVFGGKISLEVGKEQVIFNANEGATPITVSPICAIKDFNVIDNIEGPDNLEEFLLDDDLNGDLGNFL